MADRQLSCSPAGCTAIVALMWLAACGCGGVDGSPFPTPDAEPNPKDEAAEVTTQYEEQVLCTNMCLWDNDGECHDGGPGSHYATCAIGTDCADCGVRYRRILVPSGAED